MIVIVRALATDKLIARKCNAVNNNNGGFITLYYRRQVSEHGHRYWSEHFSHSQYSFVVAVKE